ncbi:App1 family protein [Dermacoccaceae bacterium W4C1]
MPRQHPASRVEDAFNSTLVGRLADQGWARRVLPYTGYAGPDFARVFARVVMSRREDLDAEEDLGAHQEPAQPVQRGFRKFFSAPVAAVTVTVRFGDAVAEGVTDRGGYIDVRLDDHGLEPGWHEASLDLDGRTWTAAVQVISAQARLGIVSDIDDTCLVTMLPRPMLAAYNSLVLHETARRVVPGMAAMYRSLLARHPGTPVVYLSTGAWNAQPALNGFLRRHGYPAGALLLTDWGPTTQSWFRSGQQHKRTQLQRLTQEFPQIQWLLIGDDGQHDPSLYAEIARRRPAQVMAIVIRRLTAAQQLLSSGTPLAGAGDEDRVQVPVLQGPDGYALHRLVAQVLRAKMPASATTGGGSDA